MTPDAIRIFLQKHYPELIAVSRNSPVGWSFFLEEVRRGGNSTRIFHASRTSANAATRVVLPVSSRIKKPKQYFEFAGDEMALRHLVDTELRLYRENFKGQS